MALRFDDFGSSNLFLVPERVERGEALQAGSKPTQRVAGKSVAIVALVKGYYKANKFGENITINLGVNTNGFKTIEEAKTELKAQLCSNTIDCSKHYCAFFLRGK